MFENFRLMNKALIKLADKPTNQEISFLEDQVQSTDRTAALQIRYVGSKALEKPEYRYTPFSIPDVCKHGAINTI